VPAGWAAEYIVEIITELREPCSRRVYGPPHLGQLSCCAFPISTSSGFPRPRPDQVSVPLAFYLLKDVLQLVGLGVVRLVQEDDMTTTKWVFFGRVVPASAWLTLGPPIRLPVVVWNNALVSCTLHVRQGNVVIEAEVSGGEPDVYTLRNLVVEASGLVVDFIAWYVGQWLAVLVDAVITPRSELQLFDGVIPVLRQSIAERQLPEIVKGGEVAGEKAFTPFMSLKVDVYRLLAILERTQPFLGHALADLREAIGMGQVPLLL